MHTHRLWLFSGSLLATAALAVADAKPDYPSCETDKDCHEKEFCVGRKCQQCRDSKDCPAGQSCNSGKCDAIPGYCRNKSECPAGQECIANQCKACASTQRLPRRHLLRKGRLRQQEAVQAENDCAQNEDCVERGVRRSRAQAGAAAQGVHAGGGLLRLQRVGADDRGDHGDRAGRRLPQEGHRAGRSSAAPTPAAPRSTTSRSSAARSRCAITWAAWASTAPS